MRPYPDIVKRYFKDPDYWVCEICDISPSPSTLITENTPQISLIVSAVLAQSERLATRLSTDTEKQLELIREGSREGKRKEAILRVNELKTDNSLWMALTANVRAKVLNFEAALVLDKTGGVDKAESLVDEAHFLAPSEDQSRLRALIAFRESGPKEALELLKDQEDIDSVNLRAAFPLESGAVEQSRSILERVNSSFHPNAETFRLRALSNVLTKDMELVMFEIQKALALAPRWKSIRETAGMISYLSALSPAGIPKYIISWPEPIDWSFVKRDDESLSRLREGDKLF